MPCRGKLVDDSEWKEVETANSYALLIGYMSMAVKGLGFLVLTWTTVVLLGGFVSMLQKKDFWCLTIITLMQTAGIFDVSLTEKLIYIWGSFQAFVHVQYAVLSNNPSRRKRHLLADGVAIVQILVFGILLCPLAVVYIFGLLISAGVSAWRLRKHDYGSNADGLGNLKRALDVLYSLALLQGVIFCYKAVYGFAKGSIVNSVIRKRKFGDQSRAGISDYLLEMTTGCEKDPSFARGRNLVTYAVHLMRSKSPDDYLSGVGILDAFAARMETIYSEWEEGIVYSPSVLKTYMQENILTKHLIMSASSSDILQKLLQTLGFESIYDRDTRGKAARIVANIAGSIRLEKFPGGVHHISSLLGTFQSHGLIEPYKANWLVDTFEKDWFKVARYLDDNDDREESGGDLLNTYKELVLQGLRILRKLAANIDNCRVMLDNPYLLPKIMAPVTFHLLHSIDHGVWSSIVEGSLRVMAELTAAQGQTGNKLRSEISSGNEVISSMERILECDKCNEKLQKPVIAILTDLYMDVSSTLETASREQFTEMLVKIMTDDDKDKETRQVTAANALVILSSKAEVSATIITKGNDNVVDNLTTMIVQSHPCRLTAVKILKHLCIYTDNNESLNKLRKGMTDAIPKAPGPRPHCLEIVRLTCEMAVSMIKQRGSYAKEDMDNLMDALSSASNEMFLLDGSMVFGVTHNDATTSKPFRSLVSLVKEAKELVDKHYGLSS